MLGLSTVAAAGQESTTAERQFSLEAGGGFQIRYRGSMQSVAFGIAPSRSLTVLLHLTRSYVRDELEFYDDGYSIERGGTDTVLSGEVRYAFLPRRRLSPFVLGGMGRGISRPNVNELFPNLGDRNIHVIYWGGGVRMPLQPRVDAFVDLRLMMLVEGESDYFAVRMPVRAGVAWRF
jgi:hypothetical protein